jgi:hypothetical protein
MYLILIGKPESLHVPYFAAGSCSDYWGHPKSFYDLDHLVGRQASRWLSAGRRSESFSLIVTHNYIRAFREALYSNWLATGDLYFSEEFLRIFPQFEFQFKLDRLENQRKELAEKIAKRVERGGFDLSKHPADQRRAIANHFIYMEEKLVDITCIVGACI